MCVKKLFVDFKHVHIFTKRNFCSFLLSTNYKNLFPFVSFSSNEHTEQNSKKKERIKENDENRNEVRELN